MTMTKTKAIRVHKTGGPEVLSLDEIELPPPAAGEVQLRHHAIGLNFIDTYFRTGLYPAPGFPFVLGNEAAGEVIALGEGVSGLKVGDRVAYTAGLGAYSEARNVAAKVLIRLPDSISYKQAAGMMLKGLTANYLLRRTFRVEKGQTVLIQAAAGGTGTILAQWARHLGATVIGTAGSADKVRLAKENGCHHVINYREEDFAARVKEITGGKGCEVAYDGVGKATFPAVLDCLKPFGLLVSFGNASGAVDGVNLGILASKGSLYVTRPTLGTHIADPAVLKQMAEELLDVVSKGVVKIPVTQEFPLAKAADAHRALESRATTGSTVLLP
jgi:NADPH2:quinone reductase